MYRDLDQELAVAIGAAHEAGRIALAYCASLPATEVKGDGSPVTQADRDAETAMREFILSRYPLDGLVGEEGANVRGVSGRRWIVDPIDGTRDYVRGTNRWAVLVALEETATTNLLVAVVYFPALGDIYTAISDQGAYLNGRRLRVSTVSSWANAVVHVNNLMLMKSAPYGDGLLSWLAGCHGVRNLGGALDAMMIASGKADVWLDPVAKAWDLAPLKLIIEEAGGCFQSNDGIDSIRCGNAVAFTPLLAAQVAALLKGPTDRVSEQSP